MSIFSCRSAREGRAVSEALRRLKERKLRQRPPAPTPGAAPEPGGGAGPAEDQEARRGDRDPGEG